jgi:hypothetical protein
MAVAAAQNNLSRRACQAGRTASNPRVTVSWQILKVVQPKAEDVQHAWDARI